MKIVNVVTSVALAGGLAACSYWTNLTSADASHPAQAPVGYAMPPATPLSSHPGHAEHAMVMPAIYGGDADRPGAPIFTNLGDHHHPISTSNPRTQQYFDQGVRLLFGFNHAEAIRSFREGARLDPECAMCWWGVAFALGPNINLPMMPDAAVPAWEAVERARALESNASANERAYIEAIAKRYAPRPPDDRHALDEAFAVAMRDVARAYPDDLDASVFFAEAMMDTQAWDYWELDGKTPKGHALEIIATLESVIKREPYHPGALHLYIHIEEPTSTPERAEFAADRLAPLIPGAGHIVHMPSHIYYRVGRYADADRANEAAAAADEAYIASCRAQGFYPAAYYVHNLHFLWTSYEMEGRSADALKAARRVVAASPIAMARQAAQAQLFFITPMMTHIRFAHWDAALAEPKPEDDLKLVVAFWHFGRGVAFAQKHDLAHARAERAALATAAADKDIEAMGEQLPAKSLVELSLAVLNGEIALTSGRTMAAVTAFRKAAAIEVNLPYTEPPFWHEPVSHQLGDALLRAQRPREAEAVYRASLKVYRRDGLALLGLSLALAAQGRQDEATATRKQFTEAWASADTTPTASRF